MLGTGKGLSGIIDYQNRFAGCAILQNNLFYHKVIGVILNSDK